MLIKCFRFSDGELICEFQSKEQCCNNQFLTFDVKLNDKLMSINGEYEIEWCSIPENNVQVVLVNYVANTAKLKYIPIKEQAIIAITKILNKNDIYQIDISELGFSYKETTDDMQIIEFDLDLVTLDKDNNIILKGYNKYQSVNIEELSENDKNTILEKIIKLCKTYDN